MRSGESEFESRGILTTNPVYKTNMAAGLTQKGRSQVGPGSCFFAWVLRLTTYKKSIHPALG